MYAQLPRRGPGAFDTGRWHHIEVAGRFTCDPAGWIEARLNGESLVWHQDKECTRPIGTVWRGAALPDRPGSRWQWQIGGYGFFKGPAAPDATVWIDQFRVETAPDTP